MQSVLTKTAPKNTTNSQIQPYHNLYIIYYEFIDYIFGFFGSIMPLWSQYAQKQRIGTRKFNKEQCSMFLIGDGKNKKCFLICLLEGSTLKGLGPPSYCSLEMPLDLACKPGSRWHWWNIDLCPDFYLGQAVFSRGIIQSCIYHQSFFSAAMNESFSSKAPSVILHRRPCLLMSLIALLRRFLIGFSFVGRSESDVDLNMWWFRRRQDRETTEWASSMVGKPVINTIHVKYMPTWWYPLKLIFCFVFP